MSVRAGVFGHALVFGLAPLLQRAAGLVLLPLYTHVLSPEQYGEIELLTIAAGLVAMVLRMELRPALLRAWVEGTEPSRAALLRATARLLLAIGLGGGLLSLLVSGPACRWLVGHEVGWSTRALVALGIAAEVVSLVPQAALQAQLRSRMTLAIGMAQFVAGTSVTVVAVALFRLGPAGLFLGGTVGLLVGLVAMAAAVRWPGPGPTAPLRPLLRYSLPLLLGALLFFVVRNADRLVVARVLSVAELGEYALAWSLANLLMTTLFLPLQSSLDVWRHHLFRQPDGATGFAEVFRTAMAAMALAAIALDTAGLDLFVEVADTRFDAATALVPALSLAVLLQVGYSIVGSAFFVAGATARWTAIFAAGAVLQVATSLVAVPALGLPGAPLGILAANAWLYAAAAFWGRRLWPVPYPHDKMAAALVLVAAISWLRRALPALPLPAAFAADVLLCLAALAGCLALGLVHRADGTAAWTMARARIDRRRIGRG